MFELTRLFVKSCEDLPELGVFGLFCVVSGALFLFCAATNMGRWMLHQRM